MTTIEDRHDGHGGIMYTLRLAGAEGQTADLSVIGITNGAERGRVYSQGMEQAGKPNIQIFGVPIWMFPVAVAAINEVAAYIMDGALIKSGQTMLIEGPFMPFKFLAATRDDGEWWTLSDEHLTSLCHNPNCQGKH